MDVSKYHTRYPPREHEEAVRMLLEGLEERPQRRDATETPQRRARREDTETVDTSRGRGTRRVNGQSTSNSYRLQPIETDREVIDNKMMSKSNTNLSSSSSVDSGSLARCSADQEEFEFNNQAPAPRPKSRLSNEELEFNSEESGSQDFIQVSPQVQAKQFNIRRTPERVMRVERRYESSVAMPTMQSKATSTASDSISTSGASTDRADAKLSHDNEDDLNGNYEAIPSRTIAIQCDLKLSSVKRDGYSDSASSDLASMQASSISSTRYGFYRLSPEVLEQRRQLVRSISSRNIADRNEGTTTPGRAPHLVLAGRNTVEAPTSISELSSDADVAEFEPEIARLGHASAPRDERVTAAAAAAAAAGSDMDSIATRSKHDQRFFSQRQRQQQVSTMARQDSLPRRPKTALSYVSTSRLRDQASDDQESLRQRCHDLPDQGARSSPVVKRMSARSRAMSQQALASAAVAGRHSSMRDETNDSFANSNSDSELGAERNRVPCQEELVVTRRGRTMAGSSPQVSRSSALRNGPLFRRAATLVGGGPATSTSRSSLQPSTGERREFSVDKTASRASDERAESRPEDVQRRVRPSNWSYSTDEENQLAKRSERRARMSTVQAGLGGGAQRYGSLSLSRRIQQQQQQQQHQQQPSSEKLNNNATHSSNPSSDEGARVPNDADSLQQAASASSYYQHTARPATMLRRDRAGSHQALPLSSTLNRSTQRSTTTSRAGLDQAQVGRSSSLRQGRSRLVVAGCGEESTRGNDLGLDIRHAPTTATTATTARRQMDNEELLLLQQQQPNCGHPYQTDDDCYHRCEECHRLANAADQADDRRAQSRLLGVAHQQARPPANRRSESEDSESPLTRTWANPGHPIRERDPSRFATNQQACTRLAPDESSVDARHHQRGKQQVVDAPGLVRTSARSHSMRDVSKPAETGGTMLRPGGSRARRFESLYRAGQRDEDDEALEDYALEQRRGDGQMEPSMGDFSACSSSLDDECGSEVLAQLQASQQQQQQQLDYDSQQRLNEIGLPEPATVSAAPSTRRRATLTGSASHLGLSSMPSGLINRYATTERSRGGASGDTRQQHLQQQQQQQQYQRSLVRQPGSATITGRAMSQQSLTRPTMPASRRLRRSGGTIGGSDSDVAGSSISLVSRLRDGSRFENAHTRSPVVMLIPQAARDSSASFRASARRAGSTRLGRPLVKTSSSRVSSQDRKNRSVSRNNSDSESSSSMLRTLIKPRPATGAAAARAMHSSRASRRRAHNGSQQRLESDEENLDEIGQLASELDSYKFRRRYSVPKDAKINWFSKLKQRVIASKG